jgi:hypothetical protein
MRAHQWIVTLGLLTLVLAAAVGLILTRQSAQLNSSSRTRRPPIVDEQPLTTARAMAALPELESVYVRPDVRAMLETFEKPR